MLPSYLNLQHGPPRHPHQHCSDDEDGDEDDHATFLYSDTQHDFPCHHCSNYSNRGHLCNIASKNNYEFMIDHDSNDDQNDSNDMSHLLLLGKFEYTGGPIFKVVLEC